MPKKINKDGEEEPLVQIIPSPRHILSDLLISLSHEASRLAAKSQKQSLSSGERKALVEFARSLSILSKEDALQKSQDLISELSDEELKQLAGKILGGQLDE